METPDDIIGMIAYGYYKQTKHQWFSNFETERGRPPTESEITDFVLGSCLPPQIVRYRQQAAETLNAFINELLASRIEKIERDVQDTHLFFRIETLEQSILSAVHRALNPTAAKKMRAQAIATITTWGLTLGAGFILWSISSDFWGRLVAVAARLWGETQ